MHSLATHKNVAWIGRGETTSKARSDFVSTYTSSTTRFLPFTMEQVSQLMSACVSENIDHLKTLLKTPGIRLDQQDDEGYHALLLASARGNIQAVQLILNACHQPKSLIKLPALNGLTPLMAASQNGHTETVSLLLQHGTNVNMQENNGLSSLIASQNGHTETVSLLLKHGANVNMQKNNEWSSLMIASQNGHTETVSLLLQHGANVNMQKNNGASSLMIASQNGRTETVSLLLQHGANVNMQENDGRSSLMIASQNGHTETVSLLLQHGANVNMQENNGASSLMIASLNGHTETVSLLLQHGANVNMQVNGLSSLSIASLIRHVDIIFLLLQNNACYDFEILGDSLFTRALQSNWTSIVDSIIKNNTIGCRILDHRTESGHTPLMLASSLGHRDLVEQLLRAGAHVNANSLSDYKSLHLPPPQVEDTIISVETLRGTALDIAVLGGDAEVVSLLLQSGAKVHNVFYLFRNVILKQAQETSKQRAQQLEEMVNPSTSMHECSESTSWDKYRAVFKLLFSHDGELIARVQRTNPSTLYTACAFGVAEMVSLLLELGTETKDLYRADESGSSYWSNLITIACSGSSLLPTTPSALSSAGSSNIADLLCQVKLMTYNSIIAMLKKHKLDINHTDSSGSFALSIASEEGHGKLTELLVKAGARVNQRGFEGASSLMLASSQGHASVCHILLQLGAKINMQDEKGWSALMFAAACSQVELASFLLQRNAKVNLQDLSGMSALMLSCFVGHAGITGLLLTGGADVNAQNKEGITALMMSSYRGHVEIVKLLLKHDASVHLETNIGTTALMFSTEEGHTAIMELLAEHGAKDQPKSEQTAIATKSSQQFQSTVKDLLQPLLQPLVQPLSSRMDKIEQILQTLIKYQESQTQSPTPEHKTFTEAGTYETRGVRE